MILNKKDTIDFLNSTSLHPRKGEMKTILDMISVGKRVGYHIEKIGIDQYKITPNYFIRDYNKPVIVNKEIPYGIEGVVDGKPWIEIFEAVSDPFGPSIKTLIYLFGLETGDLIDRNKISAYDLACAQICGFLLETEDAIYIRYYPYRVGQGYFDWSGNLNEWK